MVRTVKNSVELHAKLEQDSIYGFAQSLNPFSRRYRGITKIMVNRCRLFIPRLQPTLAGLCLAVASLAMVSSVSARVPVGVGEDRSAPVHSSSTPPLRLSQTFNSEGVLMLGDSGDRVAELQRRLADLGYYNGPISGYFGELTEAAVFDFQESQGLAVDGIVGIGTLNALRGAGSGGSSADDGLLLLGDVGPDVSAVQRRLIDLGYYQGGVDGVYGQSTEAAVAAFQRSAGLNPDGIVGSNTRIALNQGTPARPPAAAPAPPPVETPPPVVTPPPTFPPATAPPPVLEPAPGFPPPGEPFPSPSPVPPPSATVPPPVSQLPPPDMDGPHSVLDLQWKLRNQGYYYGPLDGVMGPETQRAITDAQAEYGLTYTDLGN